MKIEIVTIGDELLIGQVVDTNSAWIGEQLNMEGFEVSRINSISDSEEEILNILDETSKRADVILLTGGLGPTKDDITKITLCKYFNTQLVFNQDVYEDVTNLLKGRVRNINELNRQQALVPEGCVVIRNPVGTAPIMMFEKENTIYISMPGVPSEMKYAMEHSIMPFLKSKFNSGVIVHQTVLIHNIPEAVLAEMLEEWESTIPENIKLAYLPSPGKIRLRLTGKGSNQEKIESDIQLLLQNLKPIIGNSILAFEDITVVEIIFRLLIDNGLTLSTAESCTGGNIAHEITRIPGSSNFFRGGVVSYHNEVKNEVLGVNNEVIESDGAVSKVVVEQMANGALCKLGSDYAVATSGIAGPGGGSEEKPVGTVWIAVAGPDKTISEKFQFGHLRERNIIRATEMAMVMLKKMVEADLNINSTSP